MSHESKSGRGEKHGRNIHTSDEDIENADASEREGSKRPRGHGKPVGRRVRASKSSVRRPEGGPGSPRAR